ncbi:MAG: hypothetical protein AABX16_02320, partial [Nanoarchaeota archaeon]
NLGDVYYNFIDKQKLEKEIEQRFKEHFATGKDVNKINNKKEKTVEEDNGEMPSKDELEEVFSGKKKEIKTEKTKPVIEKKSEKKVEIKKQEVKKDDYDSRMKKERELIEEAVKKKFEKRSKI